MKEWKAKPTTPALITIGTSEVGAVIAKAGADSSPTVSDSSSETAISKLQKKLEVLHFSHGQHVIIPNHLQVPKAERSGLSFGSFDANFGVNTRYGDFHDNDKSSTPLSETSEGIEQAAEDPSSRSFNILISYFRYLILMFLNNVGWVLDCDSEQVRFHNRI